MADTAVFDVQQVEEQRPDGSRVVRTSAGRYEHAGVTKPIAGVVTGLEWNGPYGVDGQPAHPDATVLVEVAIPAAQVRAIEGMRFGPVRLSRILEGPAYTLTIPPHVDEETQLDEYVAETIATAERRCEVATTRLTNLVTEIRRAHEDDPTHRDAWIWCGDPFCRAAREAS